MFHHSPLQRLGRLAPVCLALLAASAINVRAEDSGSDVEKCGKTLGTLAVAEPQAGWHHLSQYGLGSPAALLRMMVQKSGCFDVVERGVAMQNLQQERALMQQGELRQGSNVGQGQMQAADFVMTPNVQVGAQTTGGVGGALMGRLGVLGALVGGLKFKEASTSLLLADVRSSLQVASAEGKASKTDFSIGGWGFGGGALGALGGYTSSPEGKVVAASLLDNYNRIVLEIRDKPQLLKNSSAAGDANAAAATRAEAPQPAGQMLQARIANVKAYAEPSRDSKVVATLQRTDELVATGEARNGFVRVDAANFSGWVQRTLVGPATGGAAPGPAVAPVTAAPMPAVAVGHRVFAGTFHGSDSGSFQVSITDDGQITGAGQALNGGPFNVAGRLSGNYQVSMQTSGSAGSAQFTGQLDPASGRLSGSWRIGRGSEGGGFTGQRR